MFTFSGYASYSNSSFNSSDSNFVKSEIINDLYVLNSIYDNYICGCESIDAKQIKILTFLKEDINSVSNFPISSLYKVQVKIDVPFLYESLFDTVFTYYFVKTEGEYYRLFGYLTSEILIWQNVFYPSIQGKIALISLINKSGLFTKEQKNEISHFIKNNNKGFSNKFNLPSTILQNYFGEGEQFMARSMILQPEIRRKLVKKYRM